MKGARLLTAVTLIALGAGCRPDTLDLAYGFESGSVLRYRLHATATASWDIGGQGRGGYEITYEVVEAVGPLVDGGAEVSVAMTPLDIQSQGLPAPGPEERTFTLEVGPGGEVRRIIEVDGVSAQDVDPNDLAFIGTYRPPLPLEPVTLHDTWSSEQQVSVGRLFQEVRNLGRLERLGLEGKRKVARLSYAGEGPIRWATTLPQGRADLRGRAATTSEARFDIEEGALRGARSTTSADFEVAVVETGGGGSLTGRLHLDLDLVLERI